MMRRDMSDPGPRPDLSRGHVEVICGPMFSGKTEELIRRLRRAQIARQGVLVVKPKIDDRYDKTDVVSHSSLRIPSLPLQTSAEIEPAMKQAGQSGRIAVVGVDEAQFFDEGLVEVVEKIANKGVRVVVAGLDQDYLGRPFGPMPRLLCTAEMVTKQLSVCMVCGAPASKSQRVSTSGVPPGFGGQVLVGGTDSYEARCRSCYVQGVDVPSRVTR
jgi:thymidine kinase